MHAKSLKGLNESGAHAILPIGGYFSWEFNRKFGDLPDNPGQYEADRFYQESTTDVETVYRIAQEEQVDGILAYASDPAALPAAIVAERLGLPTNPAKSVEVLGLKYPWRQFLKENGFACPKVYSFHPSTSEEEIQRQAKDFTFPVVVKPTDSSGSKGVSVLNDWTGLNKAIAWADSYSRNKVLIVEEFIQRGFPSVIGGDIFVWDGKIVLYGEMECLRNTVKSPLIPIGKKKPAGTTPQQNEAIHRELQKVITALGIRFGEMNIEILLDKEDHVHFLELGPRAGGNMIPIQLSDAFGIDLVKANVQAAMGVKPDFLNQPIQAKPGCYVHYVLHSYEAGAFKGVSYSPELKPYIYRECIYKKPGDPVEVFDGAGKALGIIFMKFPDVKTMNRIVDNLENLVRPLLMV